MVIGIDASRANVRQRTGTEWYSLQIIRGLVEQDRSQRFVLYLKEEPRPELQHLGPHIELRILRWPPRFLWNIIRLSWEMIRRPPDVLFVPAHTIPLIHPQKTVVTLHDIGFERFPNLYSQTRIGGQTIVGSILHLLARLFTLGRYGNSELDYHRWSARFALSHARTIITVSEFSKREIADVYGVPKNQIAVVYHGFDQALYRRPSDKRITEIQRHFHLRRPYIVFTGRLEKKKNIVGLLQAFAHARHHLPELELVLIGHEGLGWDEARIELRQHGLSNAAHVLGWQPPEIAIPLLAGAAALVFLSQYEGFGMPLLEAFALGVPVVASASSALPEIGGAAPLFVQPNVPAEAGRAIVKIITSRSLRQHRIALGYEQVASFTWERAARTTLEILRRT